MQTGRIEVRLAPETRRKLEEMAAARGSSVSELVRSLIERSYEDEEVRKLSPSSYNCASFVRP